MLIPIICIYNVYVHYIAMYIIRMENKEWIRKISRVQNLSNSMVNKVCGMRDLECWND